MIRTLTKVLAVILIAIAILNVFSTTVEAAIKINASKIYVEAIAKTDKHLKYYSQNLGYYTYYTITVMGYEEDGTLYPAYCVDRTLAGAEEGSYYVTADEVLDNDAVWRVIKNGYPYKTAEYWGLENDYNVYAITRYAVYCVLGQAELSYFYAEDDDDEAQAMLTALKKLVDIGENGTETQDTDPLSAKKVGKFTEDGDYYMQEYQVNSTVDFNEYTISSTSGMPSGAYISDEDGNKQTTFSEGENFFIRVPKSALTEDIDVTVNITADCQVYLILYGETTESGKQSYALTTGAYSTATTSVNFEEEVDTGEIKLTKTDDYTSNAIEGVEFALKDEEGNTVDTGTTNSSGVITFSKLVQGTYYLEETKADEDYITLDEEYEVEVEYNKTTNIIISNEKKKR